MIDPPSYSRRVERLPTAQTESAVIFVRSLEIFLLNGSVPVQIWWSGRRKGVAVFRVELDAIDMKILRELQGDGRMTNVELASRVGISAPPCLRRVRRLEESGVIEGYRALLNGPMLGLDLVAFCMVGLKHQSEANLKSFAAATASWPLVREAWMVSGDSDFLLRCVAENLARFQDFVIEELTANAQVDTVRTMLTIRQVKKVGLVEI